MEKLQFKNYKALCEYFNLKCTGGKSRSCQINKLGKTYNITKQGNSFILEQKESDILFDRKNLTSKEEKILDMLTNSQKNSFYFKNNFMIYMYKLKQTENNIYAVYNVQQVNYLPSKEAGLVP